MQNLWREYGVLTSKCADHPINDPDGLLHFFLESASVVFDAHSAWLVVAHKLDKIPDNDPIGGWRVRKVYDPYMDEASAEIVERWIKEDLYVHDAFTIKNSRLAGSHRVTNARDLLGDLKLEDTRAWELMQAANSCDRIIGVHSLSPKVEIHMGFDRHPSDGIFEKECLELLKEIIDGLGAQSWRIAFSYGLLQGQKTLTKRERETFLHLLTGKPEKEIAESMKVTQKSIHQYVIRVYQKLGIKSRPTLMAKWMSLTLD